MFTLFQGADDQDRETLIQEIAKEVARRTERSLTAAAARMNVSELRGYLRTRAAREAREQVRSSLDKVRVPPGQEVEFTAAVVERAIHLVIRDVVACPIISIPTPHVQTRAA
jgi:hypothetical protein